MGLFEKLTQVANRLGLRDKIIGWLPLLSLLVSVIGALWLAVLPLDGQYRYTYVSENALLPGQAHTHFRESEWNHVRAYKQEIQAIVNSEAGGHINEQERISHVRGYLADIGLKTSLHEWSVDHFSESYNGTNVYGVMHAPRGDNAEAMVLVAPWINQDGEHNVGGISVLIALARYLKRWSVWSKNIVFVIPSDSGFALRSWVTAYHTSLALTAGAIEGAIVLDYPEASSEHFDFMEVFYEGLNGQLPNLDLINTAVIAASTENLATVIQGVTEDDESFVKKYMPEFLKEFFGNQQMDVLNRYANRLKIMLSGMTRQLTTGISNSPGSEAFSGWRIDAITLRARGTTGPFDITTFGRMAESTLRSINNLLEHFHQSFFFYLLLSPTKFVSIGTYLPGAVLVCASFPLTAIYLYATKPNRSTSLVKSFFIIIAVFGACTTIGGVLTVVPTSAVGPVLTSLFVISACLPILSVVAPSPPPHPASAPAEPNVTLAISLLLHGLVTTALATINFSLAMVLGLLTVAFNFIRPGSAHTKSNLLILIITCPWTWLVAVGAVLHTSPFDILQMLLWSLRGNQVWTWQVLFGLWLPQWVLAVIVSRSSTPAPAQSTVGYFRKQ
jgi:glycosylphosphatidylinositol transamidase